MIWKRKKRQPRSGIQEVKLLVPGLEPPSRCLLSGVVTTTPATLFSDLFPANSAAPAGVSRAEVFWLPCADPGLQFRLPALVPSEAFYKSHCTQPWFPAWSDLAQVLERAALDDSWLANLIHCLSCQPLDHNLVTNQDSSADGKTEIRKPRGLGSSLR